MKTVAANELFRDKLVSRVRFMALSGARRAPSSPLAPLTRGATATIPNVADVAQWLRVPAAGVKASGAIGVVSA